MRKKDLALIQQMEADFKEQLSSVETSHEIALVSATTAFQRALATENEGWSSLDASAAKRNRTWQDVENNLKEAYQAWCVNPIAKSFCDYMRYFVVGKGTTITADEDVEGEDATARIKMFTDLNDWSILEKKICEELSRDGEVFVRFHDLNRNDMQTTVSSISLVDPLEIQDIQASDVNNPEKYKRVYSEVIWENDSSTSENTVDWIDGDEIHHIKINTSHNELRGRSDLLVVLPWLRQLKRWIDDMSRRNYMTGAFVWDVLVKGATTASSVTARYPTGPMPGSIIAHGENETWTPNAPDLHWADSTEGARAIKLLVMAGYKMPESWFGDTGESNLATTKALSMPTMRAFIDRQDFLKYHFEKIISKGARVECVEVSFPEIVADEAKEKAEALAYLAKAFLDLQSAGLLSRESAYSMLQKFVDELDEWSDDESGPGEKKKIEAEDADEALSIAQGRQMEKPVGEPGPVEVPA